LIVVRNDVVVVVVVVVVLVVCVIGSLWLFVFGVFNAATDKIVIALMDK
jgi:hypothetical protein